jgi:hypothetical protein
MLEIGPRTSSLGAVSLIQGTTKSRTPPSGRERRASGKPHGSIEPCSIEPCSSRTWGGGDNAVQDCGHPCWWSGHFPGHDRLAHGKSRPTGVRKGRTISRKPPRNPRCMPRLPARAYDYGCRPLGRPTFFLKQLSENRVLRATVLKTSNGENPAGGRTDEAGHRGRPVALHAGRERMTREFPGDAAVPTAV